MREPAERTCHCRLFRRSSVWIHPVGLGIVAGLCGSLALNNPGDLIERERLGLKKRCTLKMFRYCQRHEKRKSGILARFPSPLFIMGFDSHLHLAYFSCRNRCFFDLFARVPSRQWPLVEKRISVGGIVGNVSISSLLRRINLCIILACTILYTLVLRRR
jgi:hypothetical protein